MLKVIKLTDYIATPLGNGMFALDVAKGRAHAVEEVEVANWENFEKGKLAALELASGYKVVPNNVNGACLLNDGRVLMCSTNREGADSFNTGELVAHYYMLTPKSGRGGAI